MWGMLCTVVEAQQFELFDRVQVDVSGYVGWKQINSNVKYSNIKSSPELGLTTSIKFADNLTFFNQYKYGTTFSSAMVFAQLNYILPIPIDDLVVTTKLGKLRHNGSLYSSTRVNPLTRQGVFQPQSIYWDQLGQTITSGNGVGIDIQYKNLLITTILDKPVVADPIKDGQAWTSKNLGPMTMSFGHPLITLQYEIPEYSIRTLFSWERFELNYPNGLAANNILVDSRHPSTIIAEGTHQGIEWKYDDWTMSFETQLFKRVGVNWTQLDKIAIGTSTTVEYDVTDNIALRFNYNNYKSRLPSTFPQGAYFKDINAGINWHDGHWMVNVEGHYDRGGKTVDADNYNNAPADYKQYFVTGVNVVYFWE
jgi:hypothetical protein